MQTDELRAELTDLANEVPPFEGDVAAVRRRVARRRVAIGSVAAVVVVALIGGTVALTRPDDNHIHVAGSGKEVRAKDLPRIDATVLMPAGATEAETATVAGILDSSDAVKRYATPKFGSVVLAMLSGGSLLDLGACADRSTRGFTVELAEDSGARPRLTAAVGTRGKVVPSKLPDAEIEIFMKLKASPAQTAALRDALADDADVTKITFLDHQAAFREFKSMFADQPVLIEGESPETLPESFRIQTREGVDDARIAARYEPHPGVDQVITPLVQSSWILEQLRSEESAREHGPDEVELFMQVYASEAQISSIEGRLTADSRVKSFRFLSKQDAYNEYRRLFSDKPDFVKDAKPEGLPTSFRVTLADPADTLAFDDDYNSLPGVEQITGTERERIDACPQTP